MLQTLFNQDITRKQGCVYRHSSVRNLRRTNLGRVSCVSPKQEIADIFRGISVSVDFKPTGLAFIQPIIASFNFIQNPTSATEFRSMIGINSNNINKLLSSNNIQGTSEFSIRNFIDNPINFSSFGISKFPSNSQELQIFNNNMGNIELISKFNNLITNLKHSCPDKVVFKSFDITQTSKSPIGESFVINAFEFIFPKINLSSFMENILSKIELPQDVSLLVHNCQSEASSININPHQVSFFLTNKLFFNTNLQNPFISFNKLAGLENPTIRSMVFKPLEQSVFNNRQNHHFAFNHPRKSKERCFSFSLSIPKTSQIEINRQPFDFFTDFSPIPNNPSCSDNQLSREFVFQPKLLVSGVM